MPWLHAAEQQVGDMLVMAGGEGEMKAAQGLVSV
jgi:hypothetical protein